MHELQQDSHGFDLVTFIGLACAETSRRSVEERPHISFHFESTPLSTQVASVGEYPFYSNFFNSSLLTYIQILQSIRNQGHS